MVWDLSEVVLPKWTLTADYTEQIRVIDVVACQGKNRPLIHGMTKLVNIFGIK
jgi:hypothetical protein